MRLLFKHGIITDLTIGRVDLLSRSNPLFSDTGLSVTLGWVELRMDTLLQGFIKKRIVDNI